jgi:hypothetical protein
VARKRVDQAPHGIPPNVWDSITKRWHATGSKAASNWAYSGSRLKRAADVIFDVAYAAHKHNLDQIKQEIKPEPNIYGLPVSSGRQEPDADEMLWPVYYMLFGMAIECELKGLLFAKDPTKSYKDHDLKMLAAALALTLTAREAELLAILSDHVVWCGRYPAPLKPEDTYLLASEEDPTVPALPFKPPSPPGWLSQGQDDLTILNALFDRLSGRLQEERQGNREVD